MAPDLDGCGQIPEVVKTERMGQRCPHAQCLRASLGDVHDDAVMLAVTVPRSARTGPLPDT